MAKAQRTGVIRDYDMHSASVRVGYGFIIFFCLIMTVVAVFPIIWVVLAGFKDLKEFMSSAKLLPEVFDFSLFAKTWSQLGIAQNYLNSLISVAGSVVCAIVFNGLLGYGLAILKPKGYGIGKSLFDAEKVDYCKDMMKKAEEKGVKLLLPIDTVVAADFPNPIDAPVEVETVDVTAIPADKEGLDIGEKTRALFADAVKNAKTVVWNGPMGVFENPTLAKGTIAVAQALADSDAVTIVGGGDSAAACEQLGFADKITHISTGGGASLEFLEGIELPGVACLLDK